MRRQASAAAAAALDKAQDLIYDAWEANTSKRRIALAKKALAISPLCADAYTLLAEHAKTGSEEEFELWQRGVEAGKKAIGESAFDEYAGEFWGFLETRPYMRARFGLASALWVRGDRDDAIAHFQDMLKLNPNDNQGIRYVLAARLVAVGRDDELATLLSKYSDDGAAMWVWTAALAAFRRFGDNAESRALLVEALDNNEHVAGYLLGETRVPKQLPPYYSPGDNREAVLYAVEAGGGWAMTPGALNWLKAHRPAPKAERPKTERSGHRREPR